MTNGKQRSARFGIDFKGASFHAEAESLSEVAAILDGKSGQVSVFDRHANSPLFEGSACEVHESIVDRRASSASESFTEPGDL